MIDCSSCGARNEDGSSFCRSCGRALQKVGPGTILGGRFELLELIGRGGMGAVFKALDRSLDELVAVKVLRSDFTSSGDAAQRFRAEIKLARKVRHKNVCGIHEYGEDGALRFISMELIEGTDLKHELRARGAFAVRDVVAIAIQVADGLHAIHEAGIIHRDLKTANIMRDGSGRALLMDFGVAKRYGADAGPGLTVVGTIVGTPEYMSPEQIRGEKLDQRSDIYALGVVIYELVTGRVPFHGETPVATIMKALEEQPAFEGHPATAVTPELVPILRRALAKDREQRFKSAFEVAEALRALRLPEAGTAEIGSEQPTLILPVAGPSEAGLPETVITPSRVGASAQMVPVTPPAAAPSAAAPPAAVPAAAVPSSPALPAAARSAEAPPPATPVRVAEPVPKPPPVPPVGSGASQQPHAVEMWFDDSSNPEPEGEGEPNLEVEDTGKGSVDIEFDDDER